MKLYDAHNHLQEASLRGDLSQVIGDLGTINLGGAIVNGTAEDDWPDVIDLAKMYPLVIPSFGLHPWYVGNRSAGALEKLRQILIENPRALVGEIGLDKWMLTRARPDDWRLRGLRLATIAEQAEVFRAELAFAVELDRPVTLHCVGAWGPLLQILRTAPRPGRGWLLHAYSGAAEIIPELAKLGGYFSFNGRFLDERPPERREIFRHVPFDRLLVETDAPAMVAAEKFTEFSLPNDAEGHRLNHPGNLRATYRGLAGVLGRDGQELAEQVEDNFRTFVGNSFPSVTVSPENKPERDTPPAP